MSGKVGWFLWMRSIARFLITKYDELCTMRSFKPGSILWIEIGFFIVRDWKILYCYAKQFVQNVPTTAEYDK